MVHITALAVGLLFSSATIAHPGEDHHIEARERARWLDSVERRGLSHCGEKIKVRGLHAASHAKRAEIAKQLLKNRGLSSTTSLLRARDLDSLPETSHLSTLTDLTLDTPDPDVLFSSNSTCVLTPEAIEGPYYVQGELVRKDVTDDQEGVALTTVIQVLNIETCEPVTDIYLEIWHCNSTGVYSGINSDGNGNTADTSNIDKTFLRGIQPSDDNGLVVFDTLFPGHYTGRTAHIHVMGRLNAALGSNATLSDQGSVGHVGQIYFDQDLISQVEAVEPYNRNDQVLTTNADDFLASQLTEDVHPFMEYAIIGNDINNGILAWTTIGVNVSAEYSVSAAATIYADGGVENEGAGGQLIDDVAATTGIPPAVTSTSSSSGYTLDCTSGWNAAFAGVLGFLF